MMCPVQHGYVYVHVNVFVVGTPRIERATETRLCVAAAMYVDGRLAADAGADQCSRASSDQ